MASGSNAGAAAGGRIQQSDTFLIVVADLPSRFVTLFSACLTFKFFADMVKQAQEGDLKFDTTTGLNPKYNV